MLLARYGSAFYLSVGLSALRILFSPVDNWRLPCSASKNWPVTQATVTAFRATPNYQYTVGGRTYLSDRVSCNELFGWSKYLTDSEKYAIRYPLKATVTVHYHPKKLDLGVLETKFDAATFWKQIVGLSVGTLMFGFGAAFGTRLRSGTS